MRNIWKILAIGFLLIIILAGIFLWVQYQEGRGFIPSTKVSITPVKKGSPTVNPPQQKGNIVVASPLSNENVRLPLIIRGEGRVFENQLSYRLIECDGDVLMEGQTTANSPDIGIYGPFAIEIKSIPSISGKYACIEVYSNSPKDGSEINAVNVPITLDLSNTSKVKIYLSGKIAPTGEECTRVYPVERIVVKTQAVAKAAIDELLKGPYIYEKNKGYYTNINTGVKLQKITLIDGIANVDFDKTLDEKVGGSCRVTAIRQQIVQTLKQFSSVKDVIISIDGRTEDILQP